ncbi:hypothetical protein CLIB1444_01S02234 [[Candida] jaroonii]|uniref:Uncharacterized protein n=1 Tax=[Candida] jaroonii TaxID=467808 RepID=A0ACA9Y056_9ASCO|nr:hypothetical protein CLIB1444_01S02234 [[Candida] jaroonii]
MTTVAVLGYSGVLGKAVLEAFSNENFNVSFPIKVVTSKDMPSNEKIEFVKASIDETLVDKLKGIDVLISLLPGKEDLLKTLEPIIVSIKPKFYIPSEFGNDLDVLDEKLLLPPFVYKFDHNKRLEGQAIKVVRIYTGFFRFPPIFLYAYTDIIGVVQKNREVKVVGDYETKVVDYCTLEDIANSVAAIATTDPKHVLDSYRISSNRILLKDIVAQLEAEQNQEYKIVNITIEDQFRAVEQNPSFENIIFCCYSQGPGNGLIFEKNDNEVINPQSSLWTWNSNNTATGPGS